MVRLVFIVWWRLNIKTNYLKAEFNFPDMFDEVYSVLCYYSLHPFGFVVKGSVHKNDLY